MKRKFLQQLLSYCKLATLSLLIFCSPAEVLANLKNEDAPEELTVTGTVIDENNDPLPGVSIIIKGTSKGTATDAAGKFTIAAERGSILVFTFVGYDMQEFTLGNATSINISMIPNVRSLNEVVVTGYTMQSKRSITGAVSSISGKELSDVAPVSLERSLQGKVSGVYISSEGVPGGNTMVRIRGFGTTNNNDPLYVIDGVPTKGNLTSLSPSDIESITVLKDASAASIYGSRAANGVIVVTTKKGSAKAPALQLTINRGIQSLNKNRYPDLMTPQQLADAHRIRQVNGSGTFTHNAYGSDPNNAVLPDFINPIGFQQGDNIVGLNGAVIGNVNQYDDNDDNDPVGGDGVFQLMRANKQGTDWFNEAFHQADFTNVNLNYSGGGEKGTYYIGTEYFDQEGVAINTNFKRYSARINSVGNAKDWLRIGQNLNITYTEGVGLQNQYENGILAQLYRIPSIIPVYDVAGNFAGNQQVAIGDARNPVAELTRGRDNKTRIFRTFGNAFLEADIIQGLRAKTLVGVDYTTNNGTYFTPLNPGDYQSNQVNSFTESNAFNSAIIWTNTLNYSKDIGKHTIEALGGIEYIENIFRQSAGSRQSYLSDLNINERFLSTGIGTQTNNGAGAKNSLLSYFGKLDYSLADKYLASFTIRRDGSSRFPEKNRWGVFPAASVGWVISEEAFLKSVPAISSLKLRAGWGQVGNQDIPDANAANTFFSADVNYASYSLDGTNNKVLPGFDKTKRGNPDVTWETTETLNIGLDAELINRLSFSVEWYKKSTKDMLVDIVQPAAGGAATNAFLNVGNVENKGIELGLTYSSDESKDFKYSVGVNFSTYKNKVVKLNSAPFYGARAFDLQQMTITREGEAISSFYGFTIDGVFRDQAEVDAFLENVDQDGARPGTFRFRDVNNDNVINDQDRSIIGSPHPDFMYGVNINLAYKGIELSLTGTGVQGNEIFNATKYFTDFWKMDGNRSTRLLNAWTPENTNTNIPELNSNTVVRESQESTYYIEDGSFMRIRNIQLSYNLPKAWLGKTLSSAKVYLQGQNVFTVTNYSGLDPEVNLQNFGDARSNRGLGVDRGSYPIPRTISIGLNASF
jgi:TonB-linked SusC/RagA family outer membrane protein